MIGHIILSLAFATFAAIVWVGLIDRVEARRRAAGAQPMPTVRQLRRWRRERLSIENHPNRWRLP